MTTIGARLRRTRRDQLPADRMPYGDALTEDAPLDDEGKPVAIEPLPTVQVRLGIGTIIHLYQQGFDTCGPAIVWKVEPGQIVCATVLAGKVGTGITGILHLPKPSTLTIMARGGLTWHFIEECPWGR